MPDPKTDTERELLLNIAKGNEKAFRQLVISYSGLIYSFASAHIRQSELAEEIVQDVFVQLWLARHTLPEIRNLRTFLFVLARNRTIDEVKKIIRERKNHLQWAREASTNSEAEPREELYMNMVDEAVGQLPPQQRRVWVMSRREGKRYKEIAVEMGISRETVKKYLQYANMAILRFVQQKIDLLVIAFFLK